MRRLAPFGLCGLFALTLPLAAWAQSKPTVPLDDQAEQRLQQLRNAQKPRDTSGPPTLAPSEMQALIKRLAEYWQVPEGVRLRNVVVMVQVKFARDGSLAEPPTVVNSSPDPMFAVAAKSATAALTKCTPFSFLPPAKYQAWKEISIDFNPRELFGDKPR
jgi:hypothetical protein